MILFLLLRRVCLGSKALQEQLNLVVQCPWYNARSNLFEGVPVNSLLLAHRFPQYVKYMLLDVFALKHKYFLFLEDAEQHFTLFGYFSFAFN